MTSAKTLENSIFWQNVVFKQSKCPKQKARCLAAIERLTAELNRLQTTETA
jgi:hypothetical protein